MTLQRKPMKRRTLKRDWVSEAIFEEFVQTLPMAEQIRFELMAIVSDLEDLDPEEVAEQFFATNPTQEEIEEYSAQICKISEWLQSFAEELDHLEAEREIAEPSPRRRNQMTEHALRDWIADELRCPELGVKTEHDMVFGRCDIFVWDRSGVNAIIEVKVAEPIKGIGQLFQYTIGYRKKWPDLQLVLAIPKDLDDGVIGQTCKEAGITLWVVSEKERLT